MTRAPRPQPAGPKALKGSVEARRKAAVILEALAGLRTTQSASDELGIALVRYYVLETRMLQAMVTALEPRARGRKRSEDASRRALEEDHRRLQREVLRLQALYRTTQRAFGVRESERQKPKKGAASKTTKTRRPRRESRGERVVRALRKNLSPEASPSAKMPASGQGGA